MPPVATSISATQPSNNNANSFEKVFLILLFLITITQFSSFGYQSVTYILGVIFGVKVISTPLDVAIGITAMIASGLVFAGSAMCWKKMTGALKFITIGASLFIFKNIFDLINETILFSMTTAVVSMEQIQDLSGILGEQLFQMAFWILVFFYFRYSLSKKG